MTSLVDKARIEILAEFQKSALERIERIVLAWIALEKDHDNQPMRQDLLRELHTLKGESRMMGFADVSLLAHRTENLVLTAKEQGFEVDREYGDLLLAATDAIGNLLQKKAGSQEGVVDLSKLLERFESLPVLKKTDAAPSDDASPVDDAQVISAQDRLKAEPYLRIDAEQFTSFTAGLAESVIQTSQQQHTLNHIREHIRNTSLMVQNLKKKLSGPLVKRSKVDHASVLTNLQENCNRLETLASDLYQQLHESVMRMRELDHRAQQLRLVPVDRLLGRFLREARELANRAGKNIDTVIDASDVALDKSVLDRLAEPLLHLVRNAVDHGLETPKEREEKSKNPVACLTLSAKQQQGHIVVSVADDGRGIDRDRVLERAIERGLLKKDDARQLDQTQVFSFLFQPGFSTKASSTELSGRGIGLDVVENEIRRLGGFVRTESHVGKGTEFFLTVPISQTMTRVVLLEATDQWFAIPSTNVKTVLDWDTQTVETLHDQESIKWEGTWTKVFCLTDFVGGQRPPSNHDRLVLIEHEQCCVGLRVPRTRSDKEVIVGPLGGPLSGLSLITGASLLETGELVLVLNPASLVQGVPGSEIPRTPKGTREPKTRTILLAEDASVTRSMLCNLLQDLGYKVWEAQNGLEAMAILDKQEVDLVITDLSMPKMDGFALLQWIRGRNTMPQLPVVVVSHHVSVADKQQAMEAGANAYLAKTEFSANQLKEILAGQFGD